MTDRVPSLDVEACVRLLDEMAATAEDILPHADHCASLAKYFPADPCTCGAEEKRTGFRALASALPGMGKAHEAGQRALAFVDDAFEAVRRDHVGCDWDGGEIQEQLVHRGFLEERRMAERCSEECTCDFFPTTCYFPTESAHLADDAARAAPARGDER